MRAISCFNPHRPRRAGEPVVVIDVPCPVVVVSIRTGPEGPVNRACPARLRIADTSFNPHRPRRAGEPMSPAMISGLAVAFQSAPAPKGR